jgi:hypothetical protein
VPVSMVSASSKRLSFEKAAMKVGKVPEMCPDSLVDEASKAHRHKAKFDSVRTMT